VDYNHTMYVPILIKIRQIILKLLGEDRLTVRQTDTKIPQAYIPL
jgi:hypothetical protein